MWKFIFSSLLLASCSILVISKSEEKSEKVNTPEKSKLSWKDDDGLEVKIIRPIAEEKCLIKSQPGDTIEQYYKLTDEKGNVRGSNFGNETYTFKLGTGHVIEGMDRAMTGMCIGEKRKLVIPPNLGFKDGHKQAGETLYYVVQLVDLFRAVPGLKWVEDDGLSIEVVHKIDEDECIKSAPGDTIHQQYNLQLADSTWIDSSFDRKEPYIFRLGAKKVIEGIDRAMTNMCEGEHRKVIVPPHLGYGLEGSPPKIPGNATLHFYIILEKLIKKDEL